MRRVAGLFGVAALLAAGLVLVPGAREARAEPTCVFDSTAGVLTVVSDDAEILISRTPTTETDPGTILVGAECEGGSPTVDSVDLVVVQSTGRAAEGVDPFWFQGPRVTIDLGNGPFATGVDHGGRHVDVFAAPDVTAPEVDASETVPSIDEGSVELEDGSPEIEFDVRFPYLVGSVRVLGSEEDDHIVGGWRACSQDPEQHPTCSPLNLNLNGDGDADVHVSIPRFFVYDQPTPFPYERKIAEFEVSGFGGNDFISLAGGYGTGGPVRPAILAASAGEKTFGVENVLVDGGAGDDTLLGGDVGTDGGGSSPGTTETILGGLGNDVLSGGGGVVNVLEGGAGDDRFDQGEGPDGADEMRGGGGYDTVDYSQRLAGVTVTRDGVDDDGETGEGDNVSSDVENVLFPAVAAPSPVPGLEVVGHLQVRGGCAGSPIFPGLAQSNGGPCPMVVDEVNNLGLVGTSTVELYDLEALGPPIAESRSGESESEVFVDPSRAVVDASRWRVYGPPAFNSTASTPTLPNEHGICGVPFVSYRDDPVSGGPVIEREVLDYGGCTAPEETNPTPFNMPGNNKVRVVPPGERSPMRLFGVAFDEDRDDLYLSGPVGVDEARRPNFGSDRSTQNVASENLGSALIVRKVGLEGESGAEVAWDLDLRYAGCGRRTQFTTGYPEAAEVLAGFVARIGDDLLAYCWDARPGYWDQGSIGEQGYLVRIPLNPATGLPLPRVGTEVGAAGETASGRDDDHGLVLDANGAFVNYRAVRTPTLSGVPVVFEEPATGTVLVATSDAANGSAAYVFDPKTDSFVGGLTGGAVGEAPYNMAVGIDASRGRVYLLSAPGIVMTPIRSRPIPGGRLFPVAANNPLRPYEGWANLPVIPVAPKLGRLFVPVNLQFEDEGPPRYLVVEDTVVDPPVVMSDPDVNTTQVEEGPNTEARSYAEASASGAHVVYAGGPTRTVDSADPGCFVKINPILGPQVEVSIEKEAFGNGRCAAAQAVASGHREFALAASGVEAAAGTSAVGEASGLSFDAKDVTARDVEAAGDCEAGLLASLTRGGFSSPDYDAGCDQFWDGATGQGEASSGDERDPRGQVPDPRAGTRGRDGRGFPVQGASCSDFGGSPGSPEPAGVPAVAEAYVSCDLAAVSATAASETAGFTVSGEDSPLVSVARTESSTTTARTPEGQVTVSAAKAEGVVVGPLAIREVRSVAVTRAKGRTGTAVTELERRWCGVTLTGQGVGDEGAEPQPGSPHTSPVGCIDPTSAENADFLEQLNFALGGKLRITVTRANEETEPDGTVEEGTDSPGGYEAVLIKHDDARGGDAAVNDDDSITVAGLQAVVYNDSPQGRNRIVVQLAGVHAESRYGITELPDFSGFDSFSGFFSEPTFTPGIPGTPGYTIPGASELVEGETFETVIVTRGRPVRPTDPIDNLLQWVPEAVKDLLRLLVQHPLEFLLLFGVFSLLAAPAYMAHRRRQALALLGAT